jgi:hypothetical protein
VNKPRPPENNKNYPKMQNKKDINEQSVSLNNDEDYLSEEQLDLNKYNYLYQPGKENHNNPDNEEEDDEIDFNYQKNKFIYKNYNNDDHEENNSNNDNE